METVEAEIWGEATKCWIQHALYHLEGIDPIPDLSAAIKCAKILQGEDDPADMEGVAVPGDADFSCVFGRPCDFEPW